MNRSWKALLLAGALGLAAVAPGYARSSQDAVAVPAEFRHDRIFVVAKTPDGTPVSFYTDSGGGFNAIRSSVAQRLGLVVQTEVDGDSGKTIRWTRYPAFMARSGIPRPPWEPGLKGRLVVTDEDLFEVDGFLGGRWFGGRVWAIDYPASSLSMLPPGWKKPADLAERRVPLGFHTNAHGRRDTHFPRITMVVDGEPLDMLLDTGATAQLTESSGTAYGLAAGTRVAASFITKSTFDKWASRHPDWKKVERADMGTGKAFPMIEVPRITVGAQTVGPVWFTQRPDAEFREWMSQWMDKPIEGAIGGSALKHFRVVIDYPGSAAYFWPATPAGK
ncbi:MAG TPA: hypothetical protein VJO99_15760 [Burkholderiaceae bacterium]|nr:hypothetical protein [Burkholderiaceae bacterium]